MEQMVVAIFILGSMYMAEKLGQPLLNLIATGFSFYLAFTVGVPALMIILIILGLFNLVFIYNKIR